MLGYASATTAKIFSYEGQPQLKIFKEVLGGYFFDSPGILSLSDKMHRFLDIRLVTIQ